MPRVSWHNFTGGLVTTTLASRYDLQKFGTFLQACTNAIPNIHGDIERRPGMEYIATLEGESYLLPFQFSSEESENYVLVFTDSCLKVYSPYEQAWECCVSYCSTCAAQVTVSTGGVYSGGTTICLCAGCYCVCLVGASGYCNLGSGEIITAKMCIPAKSTVRICAANCTSGYRTGGHFNATVASKTCKDYYGGGSSGIVICCGTAICGILAAAGGGATVCNGCGTCGNNYIGGRGGGVMCGGHVGHGICSVYYNGCGACGGACNQDGCGGYCCVTGATACCAIGNYYFYGAGGAGGMCCGTMWSSVCRVSTPHSCCQGCVRITQYCALNETNSDDGTITLPLGINHPYALADIPLISYAQVGDIVYLAHANYPLHKLTRSGDYGSYCWELTNVILNQSIGAPVINSVQCHRGYVCGTCCNGGCCYCCQYCMHECSCLCYRVSAVDCDGIESLPSESCGTCFRYPTDWVQGDYVTLCWNNVDGACEYNVYRDSAGYYGLIGISCGCTCFQDENFEPDIAITPKEDWNPFESGNNPCSVAFHHQRLTIGGTKDAPSSFYMSRTGDFESFRKSRPLQDDDPVEYMVSSNAVDDIHWLVSFGSLFLGTSGAEYTADSSGAAITPSDVRINTQSYWGSKNLKPLIIGSAILHEQRLGSHIREIAYNWEIDGYAGNDLSLLAPELVEGHKIIQWAYQQSPGSNIWMVRDDGVLLCLTYMREQNIYAWSKHTTLGEVKSVVVLCGNNEDVVWLVVKRWIEGKERYFLEKMSSRLTEDTKVEDVFFVDCGVVLENAISTDQTPSTTICGASHLISETVSVLNVGSPEGEQTVGENGSVELQYAASGKVVVGLPYDTVISPLPIETDTQQAGSTTGMHRAYGKTTIRFHRSLGGQYAATKQGDLGREDFWEDAEYYDIPYLPEYWGDPCKLFTGDIDVVPPSGQDTDTSIILKQSQPLPFRVTSITANVDFGEAP